MDPKPDHSNHQAVENCAIVRLATSDLVAVDRCNCGTLRVHLGALTLRINAEGLQAIMETLGEALIANASMKISSQAALNAAAALSSMSKSQRGQS
ncbi:MAG: hypothetical protein ABW321_25715 [Polyangiales bacterium]